MKWQKLFFCKIDEFLSAALNFASETSKPITKSADEIRI